MPPLPRTAVVLACVTIASGPADGPRASAPAEPSALVVRAGAYDRRDSLVSASIPALDGTMRRYELRHGNAPAIPLQIDGDGRAWFVLPALAAGTERTYTIATVETRGAPVAQLERAGSDLIVTVGGSPVLRYIGGPGRLPSADIKPAYQRGGYIHPVRTPSGRSVTDDYPADHRHQHGVMFAWTSAEFEGRKTDFWNMGNALGRVEAVAIDAAWSGAVHAGWAARHRYVDLTSGSPKPVLDESWTTRVYGLRTTPSLYVFDVDLRQTLATNTPLALPEYHYGGMAVRGAASFMGAASNEIVLTSEGKDRATADTTRARWAHVGGNVDGALVGIAILGHPDNFRAPEPLRVHPTDPYICFAPSRLGGWSITAGQPFAARYRFVVADGPADAALLERLWHDYANPPTVTIR